MNAHWPLVTVLVPARDEAQYITECLDAIGAQDYPRDALEILVVLDGATRDDTQRRVERWFEGRRFAQARVFWNPELGTPSNLNLGLTHALGDFLCRVDARSRIPPDYVSRCVEILGRRGDVAVVGGAQVAIPSRSGAIGTGIARALNNRWGMGWSRYRRDAGSGPCDTVYLGAFRTDDLRNVGGWDRQLSANEDFDLNRRMSRLGIVWYDSGLPVQYVPRTSLRALFHQYARFGRWKVRYWRYAADRPRPRQLAFLIGVPTTGMAGVATIAMVPSSARPLLVAVAIAGLVAYELFGSRRPRGSALAHGMAMLASGTVALGWLGGAWGELLKVKRRARG